MFGVSACRVWKLSSRLNVSGFKCLSSVRACTTKAWKGRKDEAIESRKEVERMNIDFTLKIFQKLHSNDLNDVMKQTFADFYLTREQSLMILNSDAFMSLNDKIVLALLQNGDIIRNNVTSEELWNALAKWCKMQKMEANNESNDGKYWMQYMKPFVSFIDFTKMDATFFMDNIENISENYHIIGKDLKYDIIKQHCSDLIEKSKSESKSKEIENREIENIEISQSKEMDARMSHILKQESNLSAQWKVFQTEKEKFEKEMKLFKDAKREFENSKNNEIDASSELIEQWKIDLSKKEKQLENEKSMLNEEKEKVKLRESRLDALQRSLALRDELLMKKEAKMEEIKNDMKTSQWKINKMENEMKNKENKVKNILERLQDAEDKINEKMKKIATSKEELSPNQQSDQSVESIETFETIESTEIIEENGQSGQSGQSEESEQDNMDYKQKYQFQHWWPK